MIDKYLKYLLICKVSPLSPFTVYRLFDLLDLLTVWIWLVLSSWYNLTCFSKFTVNLYCCSVAKLSSTLCGSTLDSPVLHYLPEFAQTHVH